MSDLVGELLNSIRLSFCFIYLEFARGVHCSITAVSELSLDKVYSKESLGPFYIQSIYI